ncbi:unnamed protein product [Prorocentrum cordatum]|uniref:EF-hand domain-containing protein n=1 Tax=Prorocentrum cordatum TaxID=2364126 RepID=A0ABN9Y687_9DINO|nr:unnamed protein product [Polarella glacialis]
MLRPASHGRSAQAACSELTASAEALSWELLRQPYGGRSAGHSEDKEHREVHGSSSGLVAGSAGGGREESTPCDGGHGGDPWLQRGVGGQPSRTIHDGGRGADEQDLLSPTSPPTARSAASSPDAPCAEHAPRRVRSREDAERAKADRVKWNMDTSANMQAFGKRSSLGTSTDRLQSSPFAFRTRILRGTIASARFEIFVAVLVIINCFLMVAQEEVEGIQEGARLGYYTHYGSDEYMKSWWPQLRQVFFAIECVFAALFTIEVSFMMVYDIWTLKLGIPCEFREPFWTQPMEVLDAIRVGPSDLGIQRDLGRQLERAPVQAEVRAHPAPAAAGAPRPRDQAVSLPGPSPPHGHCAQGESWGDAVLVSDVLWDSHSVRHGVLYSRPVGVPARKFRTPTQHQNPIVSVFRHLHSVDGVHVGACPGELAYDLPFPFRRRSRIVQYILRCLQVGNWIRSSRSAQWARWRIFIQETLSAAANDEFIMVRARVRQNVQQAKKITRLFKFADSDGDGVLTKEEFDDVVSKPAIRTWLEAMELRFADASMLFDMIAGKGQHEVSSEDFIQGIGRLKGPARNLDVVKVLDLLTQGQHQITQEQKKNLEAVTLAIRRHSISMNGSIPTGRGSSGEWESTQEI